MVLGVGQGPVEKELLCLSGRWKSVTDSIKLAAGKAFFFDRGLKRLFPDSNTSFLGKTLTNKCLKIKNLSSVKSLKVRAHFYRASKIRLPEWLVRNTWVHQVEELSAVNLK